MKVATCHRYGSPDSVTIEQWPDPAFNSDEVLVAIEVAGLTTGDARIRSAIAPRGMGLFIRLAFGFVKPRRPVLGREYTGKIVALGEKVTRFQLGDYVFGITDGMHLGAHAEYVAVKADGLILKRPKEMSKLCAATFFFGGLTAADFLIDQCDLKPGERLLVVGATGAVGSAALQIAHHLGAHTTALVSKKNIDLAKNLGAQEALDYSQSHKFEPFDVILDIPGKFTNPFEYLAPAGRLGLVTADLLQMMTAVLRPKRKGGRRVCAGIVKESVAAMTRLADFYNIGAYKPLLAADFSLDGIAQAYRLADSGHKQGNIAIRIR